MRILIAGAVVFLAVWFTLLRPKADVAPATTTTPAGNVNTGAPAESTAGKIVEKAKSAATTAEGAAKAAAGESTATTTPQTAAGSTTTTAPDATAAAPAVPAATLAALPKDVAGAITGRKVLVLAVLTTDAKPWRPLADDDRYVRNTLKKVNRYDGQVLVKQVPLDQLVTYAPLVNDLHVDQTPSIVVVDPKLKASVLEGYVDRVSINQAIADARRAGTDQLITDAFLKQANQVCASGNVSLDRWSQPTVRGKKARLLAGKRAQALMRSYRRAVGKLVAPKAWKGLKREWLAELAGEQKVLDKAVGALKSQDAAGWNAMILTWNPADARKLDHRFDAAGLTSCSQLRRQ
jgi:hypothetical protein